MKCEGKPFAKIEKEYNWFNNYTNETLKELHNYDSNIAPILKWIDNSKIPSDSELFLSGPATKTIWLRKDQLSINVGVLQLKDGPDLNSYILIVPNSLKELILFHSHDSKSAGHFGRTKTYDRLFEILVA